MTTLRDQHTRSDASHLDAMALRCVLTLALLVSMTFTASSQIRYPSFGSTAGLELVGSTTSAPPALRLTGVGRMQSGAVWHRQKVRVVDGFVTTFEFQMNQTGGRQDNTNTNGGDGIAFVIQNSAVTARGGPGGNIGYDGIAASVAIEFDTYLNDDLPIEDPSANHVSLQSGPNASAAHRTTVALSSRIPALDDGGVHTAVIEYVGGRMKVFIDNCTDPAIDTPFDLARSMTLDNGTAWVGFTASTGDSWENHDILSWRFNQVVGTHERVTLCLPDTLELTAPGYYERYEWSTGETTRSILVTTGGTYSIAGYDTLGCDTRTVTSVFDVHAVVRQSPQISESDTIWICDGESVVLDGGCCTSRRWSTGDTTRQITVRTSGLYWEEVVDAWGCRGFSDSVWVLLRPNPKPVITALGATEFCQGDSVELMVTEHARYRWSTGDTTRSIFARESGQYSVEVFDSNGCRGTSASIVVLVPQRPRPVVRFIGPRSLCEGAETTLDAGAGFASYSWSTGETTRRIIVGTAGTYTVTVASDRGCVGQSQPVTVAVAPRPRPEIVLSGRTTLCQGERLTLSSRTAFAGYRWSTGDTSASIVVDADGGYTLTAIDSNGCEGTSVTVQVRRAPAVAATIDADGPISFCRGGSVTLRAPGGMRSYVWSTGETSPSIVVSSTGRYHVHVIDTSGCAASDSVYVSVFDMPEPIASGDTTICAGGSATLDVTGANSVKWSPIEGLSCDDCPSPVARPTRTTTYVATATGGGACVGMDSVTITVTPAPAAVLTVGDGGAIYPGRIARVPVYLDGDLAEAGADEMMLRVDYGSAMMMLTSVGPIGPLAGWSVETIAETPGRFTARLRAPSSQTFSGIGHVLDLEFQTYIGDSVHSRIDAELTLVDRPCASISARPGALRLDSICGMSLRMIESFASTLALEQNTPNPFNPSTEITFSVPLDGSVRLDVHRSDGTVTATLVDDVLGHGTHAVVWDASDQPSGLYVCRLTTGTGSRSIQMLLLK